MHALEVRPRRAAGELRREVALLGAGGFVAAALGARAGSRALRVAAVACGALGAGADGAWLTLAALAVAEAAWARGERGSPGWAIVVGWCGYVAARAHGPLAYGQPDPVAVTAPVALSVLFVAHRLRSSLDPRAHAVVRWAAAGAVYLAAFGQNLVDPFDAALLATLGVVGMAVGAALRVRAYLFLGAGAVAAAAITPLVRFGGKTGGCGRST